MNGGFWGKLAKPIIGLAPMDGVSDAPFRYITAKYGQPSVMITEFTNVEALSHGAVKALTALIYDEIERPIVAQIYGTNPDAFYKACFVACELGFDGIDINMGCPSKSVSGNGAGAGLIRTPMLAQEIIQTCQQAVTDWSNGKTIYQAEIHRNIINYLEKMPGRNMSDTSGTSGRETTRRLLPISIKTRIGYDKIITEDWIKNLLETKPANISLHGRTLKQMYTGQADWEEIAKAAAIVHESGLVTTILGNGDAKSITDAHQKIATYGVDGVLIGRGAFGEPWIFEQIRLPAESVRPSRRTQERSEAFLQELPRKRTIEEKLSVALEHARYYESIFGIGPRSFAPMKKHFGWYCSDFPHAKDLRMKLMTAENSTQIEKTIEDFLSYKTLPV
jgi:tRNA-dihydrouridine synthase